MLKTGVTKLTNSLNLILIPPEASFGGIFIR